jgi:hypothetical protein
MTNKPLLAVAMFFCVAKLAFAQMVPAVVGNIATTAVGSVPYSAPTEAKADA